MSANRSTSLNYFDDTHEDLRIYKKVKTAETRLNPPKIKGKHYTNIEFLANAELIWLTPKSHTSRHYNENSDDSFFEQCFRTCEKLGEGSYGSVIKVKSLDDDQLYAMKVMKEPYKNEFDRKLSIREVEHHQALSSHPNIITLHKAWEEDRFIFMQLELCRKIVENGTPLPEIACWKVIADILQALEQIHETQRGHFDIKVDNILLGEDSLYKLCDFGLMIKLGQNDQVLKEGDSRYVAPELMQGSLNMFTPKADIFSLAIAVLELGCNIILPNGGATWRALREGKLPLASTKDLSYDLLKLLTLMLTPDPEQRPSAKELLAHPRLQEIVNEERLAAEAEKSSFEASTSSQSNATESSSSGFSEWSMSVSDESSTSRAQPTNEGPTFTSTPIYIQYEEQHDTVYNKILRIRRERTRLLNRARQGMEDSGPSRSLSPVNAEVVGAIPLLRPARPPTQIKCDWVGITSPDKSIRQASRNRNRLHCPAESLLKYGISPLRLSKELKREYFAQKSLRIMSPRNLAQSFRNEDDLGEDSS